MKRKPQPITGALRPEYKDRLDWTRLYALVDEVILQQPDSVRKEILEHPEIGTRVRGFDADGYATFEVLVQPEDEAAPLYWSPLLRFHWTRLVGPPPLDFN